MANEVPKTKLCKHCKMEIPMGAKVCPHCRKSQNTSGCLTGCLVAIAMFFGLGFLSILAIPSSNRTNQTKPTNTTGQTSIAANTDESANEENAISYEISDTKFEYYTNRIGNIEYYGYVEILNTGSKNLYLKDCSFDLEDNDGHLLQTDDYISNCPSVIAPGEKGYFYNGLGSSSIDKSISFDNGINLVPNYKIEEAKKEFVNYEVSDTALKEGSLGHPTVTGRITNNSNEDDSMCYVNVIFYDANGKVLAITGTNVMDLTVGSTKSFECQAIFTSDSLTMDSVADYKVIAQKSYYQF